MCQSPYENQSRTLTREFHLSLLGRWNSSLISRYVSRGRGGRRGYEDGEAEIRQCTIPTTLQHKRKIVQKGKGLIAHIIKRSYQFSSNTKEKKYLLQPHLSLSPSHTNTLRDCFTMELSSRRRWRLVSAQVVSCCVYENTKQ